MKNLSLFLFVTLTVSAQEPKVAITNANPQGGQHALMPLRMTEAKSGEKLCAPYFLLIMEYKGPNNPGIMFKYAESNKEIGLLGMMSKSKFTVIIDGSKKVPTIEMVSQTGVIDKNTKVIVNISKPDYEKARGCLAP